METLRFLILSTLVLLSLQQRRAGAGGELGGRSPFSGRSSQSHVHLSREVPSSSAQTQETEYVYEYYDEPDYQQYPPKSHVHPVPNQQILDALQGRSVNVGSGNSPTASTAVRANILASGRERYVPTSSTKRPALLHAQLSRFVPNVSNESREKSSTEAAPPPLEEEYEYVYEEEPIGTDAEQPPSKEVETKVSVSVSASQQPSTPSPKVINPDTGIVISVATTKSVSSRLNPSAPTTPSTLPTSPTPHNLIFRRPTGSSIVVTSVQKNASDHSTETEFAGNYPVLLTVSTTSSPPKGDVKLTLPSDLLNNGIVRESSSSTTLTPEGIKFEDVSPFLPPDYKKPPPPIQSLLPKILFQEISQDFLPKDYVMSTSTAAPATTASTTTSTTPPPPKNPLEALMSKIRFEEDISKLLPPGYKASSLLPADYKPPAVKETTLAPPTSTVAPPSSTSSPSKVVFPTRAGGFKAIRPTTPEPSKAETPSPLKVALKTGWPTRKTMEFTGWPTSSTTPSTTTTTSSTTTPLPPITEPTTTTERTTTTAAPPKRSPATLCELNLCKMEATLRLTGGVRWKPEYSDINTEEWKHLENTVKRELDGAYRSSGLAPFYRSIEIEAFNEGSVVVDYFLFLDNVDREISSEQVRSLFHAALLQGEGPFDEERLRLGRYSIDPRYTDFKVRSVESEGVTGELEEALIPQWGIAVIVIGLASLLFVIIFAVTLMVSKQRKGGKKGGVSLTQEMLNEFNKRSMTSGDSSVRREDLYNMEDVWDESHLERTLDLRSGRRSSLSKEGYNIYDSWKTEWNGYNQQFGGDSYTRRRSDYDTNF